MVLPGMIFPKKLYKILKAQDIKSFSTAPQRKSRIKEVEEEYKKAQQKTVVETIE